MAGYKCPFCDEYMSIHHETKKVHRLNFYRDSIPFGYADPYLEVTLHKCPNEECKQISVYAHGVNGFIGNNEVPIYPQADYIRYPDYVPAAIRSDYEEACKILHLSPKAAATLARRCLQGMIRDFWGIKEKTLNQEISKLQGQVPAAQWRAIDAVRKIGNIGAHMEKDVSLIVDIDPDESQKLLLLIEHLIEAWYIDRHEAEELYTDLIAISDEKADARTG